MKENNNIKRNVDDIVIIPSDELTNQQKNKLFKNQDLMKSINKINQVSLKNKEKKVEDEIINSSSSVDEIK